MLKMFLLLLATEPIWLPNNPVGDFDRDEDATVVGLLGAVEVDSNEWLGAAFDVESDEAFA
jgi:hypothetical protein